jgi:hypothetical protein
MKVDGSFDIENLRLVRVPHKIAKRRQHFIKVPFEWLGRLKGVSGQTWHLSMHLLYLHWKSTGKPIKLANGMLEHDGISRASKWRALAELEARGLILIERRARKSPLVRLVSLSQN